MSWRRQLTKLGALFRRSKPVDDLEEEIRSHLEMEEQENLESGMRPDEAHYAALRRFGNVTLVEERSREMWGWNSVETLGQDLRYGLRILAKSPVFTAVAVLTLALGIGVDTTLFTAINAVALRPIPGRQSDRLVRLARQLRKGDGAPLFSYPEYTYYRDANRGFSGLVARACCFDVVASGLPFPAANSDSGASAERVSASLVSGNFFDVLGMGATVGRTFLPEEDETPGAHAVVLVGHGFWRARFGSDPRVIGRTILLNDTPFTIIGVAPPGFVGTADPPVVSNIWVPFAMQEAIVPGSDWLHDISEYQLSLVGRLKPGISTHQARAELTVLATRLGRLHPEKSDTAATTGINVASAKFMDFSGPEFVALVAILTAAVAMVLLIACANVASLSLAKAATREKEIAVRLALGASRARLVRQLVMEGVPIALLGGATGMLFSFWGCTLLWRGTQEMIRNLGGGVDFVLQVGPDFRVLAFTLLVSLATALFFGLAPALRGTKVAVSVALKDDNVSAGQALSGSRFRNALVVAQVAVSMVLLSSAGLLVRGLIRAESVDPGFETKNVAFFELELQNLRRRDQSPFPTLYRQVLDRLRSAPDVQSVALASHIPLFGAASTSIAVQQTRTSVGDLPTKSFYNVVSPSYFGTLSIPILRGRAFTDQDGGGLSVIVSESTAKRLWAGENPIGKRIKTDRSPALFEVVGIAKDTRSVRLSELDPLLLYFPLSPKEMEAPEKVLLVRTENRPDRALPGLLSAMAQIDRRLPLASSGFHTLYEGVWYQKLPSRVGATIAAVLGCLALVLSSMGIYGLVSYVVSRRTRELGIRVALGATQAGVLTLMLGQLAKLVLVGMGAGLVGSAAVSHILVLALARDVGSLDLLFGLSWLDPVAFGGVSLLISSIAFLAGYIAARRATKVDPMLALRCE